MIDPYCFRHEFGEDLLELITAFETPLVEVTPLSGLGYPGYEPHSFRLLFADGRILKGRRFGNASRAAAVEYVSQFLNHEGFPKVLARARSGLLIEWIDGKPVDLTGHEPELLKRCGALQGFMHSISVPRDSPWPPRDTIQTWHSNLRTDLDFLAERRVLDKDESRRAYEIAAEYAPDRYEIGFVHRDFCPENLIVRPSGDLCAIDNETLAIDSYDYDLGRTWYRWPMTPLEQQHYLEGYERYRSPKDFLTHFSFWGIAAVVKAAVFRLEKHPAAAAVPIARLRSLLRDSAAAIAVPAATSNA